MEQIYQTGDTITLADGVTAKVESVGDLGYSLIIPAGTFQDCDKDLDAIIPIEGINDETRIVFSSCGIENIIPVSSTNLGLLSQKSSIPFNAVVIETPKVISKDDYANAEINAQFTINVTESLGVNMSQVSLAGLSVQSRGAAATAKVLCDMGYVPGEVYFGDYSEWGDIDEDVEIFETLYKNGIKTNFVAEDKAISQRESSVFISKYTGSVSYYEVGTHGGTDPHDSACAQTIVAAMYGDNFKKTRFYNENSVYVNGEQEQTFKYYKTGKIESLTIKDENGRIIEEYKFDANGKPIEYYAIDPNTDRLTLNNNDLGFNYITSSGDISIDYKPIINMFDDINNKLDNFDISKENFVNGETGGSYVFNTVNEILNGYITSSKGLLYGVRLGIDEGIGILQSVNNHDFNLSHAFNENVDLETYQYVQGINQRGTGNLEYDNKSVNLYYKSSSNVKLTKDMLNQAISVSNPIYSMIDYAINDFIELNNLMDTYVNDSISSFSGVLGDETRNTVNGYINDVDTIKAFGEGLKESIANAYKKLLKYMGEFDTLDMSELPSTIEQIDLLENQIQQLNNKYEELKAEHGKPIYDNATGKITGYIDNSTKMAYISTLIENKKNEKKRLVRYKEKLEGLAAEEEKITIDMKELYFAYNGKLSEAIRTSLVNSDEYLPDKTDEINPPQEEANTQNIPQSMDSESKTPLPSAFKGNGERKTYYEVAYEIYNTSNAANWGNGSNRIENLQKNGYNSDLVQKIVNMISSGYGYEKIVNKLGNNVNNS